MAPYCLRPCLSPSLLSLVALLVVPPFHSQSMIPLSCPRAGVSKLCPKDQTVSSVGLRTLQSLPQLGSVLGRWDRMEKEQWG